MCRATSERSRSRTGEAAVYALDGVDFALEKGKICVILGPSGSGKSTLLVVEAFGSAGVVAFDGHAAKDGWISVIKINEIELFVEFRSLRGIVSLIVAVV